MEKNGILVSATWLHQHREMPEIVILDARLRYDPASMEKEIGIAGARIFDLENEFSDKNSPFPNMLPSPEDFEESCKKWGINNSSKIVVYDHRGIYLSPRVWWMFKVMGHKDVRVLNGGFPAWGNRGYAVEKVVPRLFETGNFKSNFNPDMVVDYDGIRENIKNGQALVIDVRSSDRFHSLVPEPRKGLGRGHIPNSINIPYLSVLEDGKYKSLSRLKEVFAHIPLEGRTLVFSCGSGVTACIVLLASEICLQNEHKVYDGSWTEYAQVVD